MKREIKDWTDEEEIDVYLQKLLHKEAFDRSGLIYGMGHAVCSISDPRAIALKSFVKELAVEKGLEKGREEGREEERLENEKRLIASAKKMVASGVDIDLVCSSFGVDKAVVQEK